ncbi:methyltransferase domain-containing protein [Bacillus aerolatus]|uniref:Methyltransferase domain-containing protein n=1 Tax=Bacillus aerolatus TaxID=2653354 RepID=A0A6I1FN22_9BACI|nr:class I SAM-dependent methyltransferase [Bacillus aerolatus]KAB7707854.1 methyltransferase domain-containing protein [Bacillus aerolatus]
MKYTGERVLPDTMNPMNGMLLEHIARYQFAIYYSKGRVLDIASGSGFGTQLIAKAAKSRLQEVVGVDIDQEATDYANGRYYHPLVTYKTADAADPFLPETLGKFDAIFSFETIEHISGEISFLRNLFAMLKPGGTLVISTPFGLGRGQPTTEPFHVHQLTEKEFFSLFDGYNHIERYYQRGVLIEPGRPGRHYPIGIAVCIK